MGAPTESKRRRRTRGRIRRSFPTAVSTASGSKGLSQPPPADRRGTPASACISPCMAIAGQRRSHRQHVWLFQSRRAKGFAANLPVATSHFSRQFRMQLHRTDFARNYLMRKAYEVLRYARRRELTAAGSAWSSAVMTQRNNHSQIAIARPHGLSVVARAGWITLATVALITVLVLITGPASAEYGFA